jgi:hypothetical protein
MLDPVEFLSVSPRRTSIQGEVSSAPTAAKRYLSVVVVTEASDTVQRIVLKWLGPHHCVRRVSAINRVVVAAVPMPSASVVTEREKRK